MLTKKEGYKSQLDTQALKVTCTDLLGKLERWMNYRWIITFNLNKKNYRWMILTSKKLKLHNVIKNIIPRKRVSWG
jgi:hypothetical protein